jgi:hypothetical protein
LKPTAGKHIGKFADSFDNSWKNNIKINLERNGMLLHGVDLFG